MVRGSLRGFLAGLAVFYAILADVRNCPGVTPTRRFKWWESWLWSENPAQPATSARDRSVLASRALGSFDAARAAVLGRRQPRGRLELAGELVGAQVRDRSDLLQRRPRVKVFLDVLDDGAEPRSGERAGPPANGLAGCRDVPDQVDGQDVGQRLGGQPPPGAAGRQLGQLGIRRQHRGPQVRQVQAVQRRERHPRWVEAERLGGDAPDQSRLQVGVQRVPGPFSWPPPGDSFDAVSSKGDPWIRRNSGAPSRQISRAP